ncbi:MAG TPA: hypothetical protein VGO63_00970 [Candidatus Paceibacterota bacterium]|jgi:hypothetical protein|nr:hypothetical protein [Candidatus Paceibacterota bacterium]
MRKPKEKIKLEIKAAYMGQYGTNDEEDTNGEFEVIEEVEEKYARSIGRLVISFSALEDRVDVDLATAISDRAYEPGYRIIKYLEFRQKIDLLRDDYFAFIKYCLTGKKQSKLLSEIKLIYLKLVELSEFRNIIAHANWQSLDEAGFVRYKSVENREGLGMNFRKIKITPSIILKFIRQNYAIASQLSSFRDKVWEADNKEEARRYKKANPRKIKKRI